MVSLKKIARKKEELITYILDLFIILALIFVLSLLPFEAILSEYPYAPTFPWHPYWRTGLVSFFIWFISILALSAGLARAKPFVYISSCCLVIFHYVALISLHHMCSLKVGLLSYSWNCRGKISPPYLDVSQLALLVTFLMILAEKRRKKAT